MKTTINWRPYPEQKPPKAMMCTVMVDGEIEFRKYNVMVLRNKPEWFTRHVAGERVTHFALPEDITTEES